MTRKPCDSQGFNEICDSQLLRIDPRVSLSAYRRAKTSIHWVQVVREGRTELMRDGSTPAAMPEFNCRRCLEQESNVLIDEVSLKYEYLSPVPLCADTVRSTLHAVMQSHRAAVPPARAHGLGKQGGRNGGGVPSRVDPAGVDMGPFDPCAMARPAFVPNCLPEESRMLRRVVRPRPQKHSIVDSYRHTTMSFVAGRDEVLQ
jgi:hypothetical protein